MTVQVAKKLAEAAEELVKLDSEHVGTASRELGIDALEKKFDGLSVKTDALIAEVSQIRKSTEALVAEVSMIKKSTETLINTVGELKSNSATQSKIQSLQWAISNSNIGSFKYFSKGQCHNSACLVQGILGSFMQNGGYYINGRSKEMNSQNGKGEKEFRDLLVAQIHQLTGVKPVVDLFEGEYAIYCS